MSATIHIGGAVDVNLLDALSARIGTALGASGASARVIVRAVERELRNAASEGRAATFETAGPDFDGLEHDLAEMEVPFRCISGSGPARVVSFRDGARLVFELSRDGEPVAPLSAIAAAGAAHVDELLAEMRGALEMPPPLTIVRPRAGPSNTP